MRLTAELQSERVGSSSVAKEAKATRAAEAAQRLKAQTAEKKMREMAAELEKVQAELVEVKRSQQIWSKRCREALLCETTKVLVSCPKVTLALGEKDLPVYGSVDLEDVSKVIRESLLPKYTAVLAVDEKSGADIHETVESLCNALVTDIAETLKKKVPAVNVNARRLSKEDRRPSKG
jgi:hypothetical protein